MRLTCKIVRIRLSRLVAVGEDLSTDVRLATHVAKCSECAREWEALGALAHDLPGALPAPQPSTDFVARTMRRLEEHPRPAHAASWLPLPAAVAVAALLMIFAWWTTRPTPSSHTSGEDLVSKPIPAPAPAPSVPEAAITQPTDVPRQVASDSDRTPPPHKPQAKKVAVRPRKVAAPAPGPTVTPHRPTTKTSHETIAWEDWGDWYAEAGAYAHASDAYARAYETTPDSSLAFATGYTAEAAGDVYQAVTYYSQYLTQADGT